MSDAQDIEMKAAEWLVRRDANDEASPDFTAWLAADPRHRAAYLRLAAAWERTVSMNRLRPEGSSVDPDLLSPRPKRGFRFWTPLAIAAGVAVIAVSATWWATRDHGVETYRTDVGGLSRIVLADGSTVTLNTDTELRVRLLPKRREITLVHGEAQFSVAHDVNRPFEVSAGARVVRAVGTAFDVRLTAPASVEVMVTEGKVAVLPASLDDFGAAAPHDFGMPQAAGRVESPRALDSPRPSVMVSAGESAVAEGSRVTVHRVSTTEASRRLAWEVGELSFQGETLKEAVAEFNRYNHRKLEVQDPAIAELEIGGNFNALDQDSFVAALNRSFGVIATEGDDGNIVLRGSKRADP